MTLAICVAFAFLATPTSAGATKWGAPVDLTTPSEYFPWEPSPEVAMSRTGAVATWEQVEGARESVWTASMSPTGSWSPAVEMPMTTWYEKSPQIAINEAGEAVVVWEAIGEQVVVMAAVRSPSGQWEPAVPISPEGSTYTDLDVAVGPNGEAVAAWCQVPRYGSPRGYRIEAAVMSGQLR